MNEHSVIAAALEELIELVAEAILDEWLRSHHDDRDTREEEDNEAK